MKADPPWHRQTLVEFTECHARSTRVNHFSFAAIVFNFSQYKVTFGPIYLCSNTEDQRKFVRWWDEKVGVRQSPGINQHTSAQTQIAVGPTLPKDDAEALTGITQQQVARWRKSLADANKYRDKAGLWWEIPAGVPPNRRAKTTES